MTRLPCSKTSKWVSTMSTSNLPIPDSIPEVSAASIPAHGDVSALTGGQGYVPDVALIERLANELFAGVPGQLAAYVPSLGSATPPRNNDLAFPLTGGDPLDLHLESRSTPAPQIPVNHAWAPGADFALAPNLEASYPGEDVLRDLLKNNAKEHPKMTGATLYFLDEAARFSRSPHPQICRKLRLSLKPPPGKFPRQRIRHSMCCRCVVTSPF